MWTEEEQKKHKCTTCKLKKECGVELTNWVALTIECSNYKEMKK